MGASTSKPQTANTHTPSMTGTPSSAAFGRLRFDSPGRSPLLQRRLAQRQQQHHHHHHDETTVIVPRVASSSQLKSSSTILSNEKSSLLTKPSVSASTFKEQLQSPPQQQQKNDDVVNDKRKLLLHEESSSSYSVISAPSPPTLLVWIGPALTCALCYALYNIFIKKGSSHISPILGGVILQLVAAMFGSALLLYLLLTTTAANNNNISSTTSDQYYYTEFSSNYTSDAGSDPSSSLLTWNAQGLMWAILAGMAVGAAEMISFFVSSLGVQAMQSIPIIVGGSVLMGTLLGWLWLGEQLTIIGWSGVCLISMGIALVGLDAPADAHH